MLRRVSPLKVLFHEMRRCLFQVLSAKQVGELSVAAAVSVSKEQMDKLPEDSKKALDKVTERSEKPENGAEHGGSINYKFSRWSQDDVSILLAITLAITWLRLLMGDSPLTID